ncbi:ATP-dependent DNA helicase, partial [Myxococcota bacterium]
NAGLAQVRFAFARLWEGLSTRAQQSGYPRLELEPDQWTGNLTALYHAVDSALETLLSQVGSLRHEALAGLPANHHSSPQIPPGQLELLERRAAALRDDLAVIVDGARGRVTWLEADPRQTVVGSSPISLGGLFRHRILETVPAVVLTSATLSGGPPHLAGKDSDPTTPVTPSQFPYLRSRLGLEDVELEELAVPSPFDYAHSALLYTPTDLPHPNQTAFLRAALERTIELVRITKGGAMVLTTSVRSLEELGRSLARRMPDMPVLVQGQAPKRALLDQFRDSGNAVLVATLGFWAGVDVPGHALRLVVLEKAPFAVPTDPLVRARARALEEQGRNPFMDLLVPAAGLTLRQGFGRLIRTRSDRGIVALLDGRVLSRGYGKRLLAALPQTHRTTQLEDVRAFWQDAKTRVAVP